MTTIGYNLTVDTKSTRKTIEVRGVINVKITFFCESFTCYILWLGLSVIWFGSCKSVSCCSLFCVGSNLFFFLCQLFVKKVHIDTKIALTKGLRCYMMTAIYSNYRERNA